VSSPVFRIVANPLSKNRKSSHQEVDDLVHMDLAHDVLRAILGDVLDRRFSSPDAEQFAQYYSDDYKKALCQTLNKLYIPSKVDDDDKIRTLKLLVHYVRTVSASFSTYVTTDTLLPSGDRSRILHQRMLSTSSTICFRKGLKTS
jgi:hypothetical protein